MYAKNLNKAPNTFIADTFFFEESYDDAGDAPWHDAAEHESHDAAEHDAAQYDDVCFCFAVL